MYLKAGERIEDRNRQETEDRFWRESSEFCICPNLFLIALIYTKQEGRAKDFYAIDTRNK